MLFSLNVDVAQVVERGTHKPNVGSASLPVDTIKNLEKEGIYV